MNHQHLIDLLLELGNRVCLKIHRGFAQSTIENRSAVYKEGADDTIYQIDRDVEELVVPFLAEHAAALGGLILIGEGLGDDPTGMVLPAGLAPEQAALRLIMDPIDGTRGIMYDKRSAFFLAAVAPNKGDGTTLQDIEVAVMTELPTSRSHLSDSLWAIKGQGARARTRHLYTDETWSRPIAPSRATTIIGGFAQISRFFPPGREVLARIEDELIEALAPNREPGRAVVFEDQYIASSGQLYEILMGHDRFIADLRTLLYRKLAKEGKTAGHVCHPYDLCTTLIATESGVIVTDAYGQPLNAPLDVLTPVDWIGYANEYIRKEVEPELQRLLRLHGLFV